MVHLVLEVTEVESIERKERDGRGKGNEGFPEHSTHFSLSLSLSPRGQQHRPLDSRRHSWKRNLIREKLNSFKCTSPPSSYSTPPRSRAFPTFLSLSLLSFFRAPSKACSFFTHPQPFPSRKRRSAIYSFLSSLTSVLTLLSVRLRITGTLYPLLLSLSSSPSSAVRPRVRFKGEREFFFSFDYIPILGKPTRDPPTSDCLTPLINLVQEESLDFGCSFPPFFSLSLSTRRWHATLLLGWQLSNCGFQLKLMTT